ncbi:hypothetical protein Adt_23580 [Abeliophyllum distichum]|uniref:Uncharacterized protein n=1 Tax=Abeliophyllum distichum TaxID=126358 RepID=A0ABD1SBQ3_9LAMI
MCTGAATVTLLDHSCHKVGFAGDYGAAIVQEAATLTSAADFCFAQWRAMPINFPANGGAASGYRTLGTTSIGDAMQESVEQSHKLAKKRYLQHKPSTKSRR